jgi:hypothetical protein
MISAMFLALCLMSPTCALAQSVCRSLTVKVPKGCRHCLNRCPLLPWG